MLKKLLKYDLKAMFRYWWIAALTLTVISVAAGFVLSSLTVEKDLPTSVYVLSVLGFILIMLGFSAFSIMAIVVIFSRFYKNFFTDEGYLTFTLPVKRRDLLNSKIISGFITFFSTSAVIAADVIIALTIGLRREIFTKEFFDTISEFFNDLINELGFYTIIYAVEAIIISLLMYFICILFMYCCITIGSIIVKKAKVLVSVGIFYGSYCVISFAGQILWLFGIPAISNMLGAVPDVMHKTFAALILLGIICIQAALCTLMYIMQYFMLDRKLNLN